MKDSKMAIKCNQTLSMHKRDVYEIFYLILCVVIFIPSLRMGIESGKKIGYALALISLVLFLYFLIKKF